MWTAQADSGAPGGDNLLDLDLLGDSVPAATTGYGAAAGGAAAAAPAGGLGGMDDLLDLLGASDSSFKPAAAPSAACVAAS